MKRLAVVVLVLFCLSSLLGCGKRQSSLVGDTQSAAEADLKEAAKRLNEVVVPEETALSPLPGELSIARRPPAMEVDMIDVDSLPQRRAGRDYISLLCHDVSDIDLGGLGDELVRLLFSLQTRWPDQFPSGFEPDRWMELGKNPGLGLRLLHEHGITGRGVGIGIIDQHLLVDHVEYRDRVRHYEEIGWPPDYDASFHGPAVASLALGRTVGVAPEADLYFVAAPSGNREGGTFAYDYTSYAQALNRLLELNQLLPSQRRIRVISISLGFREENKGFSQMWEAMNKAREQGVLVCAVSHHGSRAHRRSRCVLLLHSRLVLGGLQECAYDPASDSPGPHGFKVHGGVVW